MSATATMQSIKAMGDTSRLWGRGVAPNEFAQT